MKMIAFPNAGLKKGKKGPIVRYACLHLWQSKRDLGEWVVVVAQLAERSLPTPEIRGSNPDIGKLYLPIVH